MSFLSSLFRQRKSSANVAKERLQIVLTHERGSRNHTLDYLPRLQRELLDVISKYAKVDPSDVDMYLEHRDTLEILKVKIEMPQQADCLSRDT